jgi:hypothetical protein
MYCPKAIFRYVSHESSRSAQLEFARNDYEFSSIPSGTFPNDFAGLPEQWYG